MAYFLFGTLIVAFIAIGAANVYVVSWCHKQGGTAVTPFMTTECRR